MYLFINVTSAVAHCSWEAIFVATSNVLPAFLESLVKCHEVFETDIVVLVADPDIFIDKEGWKLLHIVILLRAVSAWRHLAAQTFKVIHFLHV